MQIDFKKATQIYFDNTNYLAIECPRDKAEIFLSEMKEDKKYTAEIKEKKERRSLNANAYFHLMVNKIAEKMKLGNDEIKIKMNLEYGTLAKDDNGTIIGFKLPENVDVNILYPYSQWFDCREENGIKFNCYKIYKQTRTLNTKEMARLIDGVVSEAKELGIETLTPAELEKIKGAWSNEKHNAKQ